jgi:hypothetical protein
MNKSQQRITLLATSISYVLAEGLLITAGDVDIA